MTDMAKSRKIFVGYDTREDIAWEVCRHSIQRNAQRPIDVHPLKQASLRELGLYHRDADGPASTEFSLTRFLTPYIAGDVAWSLFVDCDTLFTRDVHALFDSLDPSKAIYVVKHDYVPANAIKMDGKGQSVYPRKNWSSFMIFNGRHPAVRALTPAVVNSASPAFLHRLEWIADDESIGELGIEWNFLVGEYDKPDVMPANIHFTNGGPWFADWVNVDYGELWTAERDMFLSHAGRRAA